MEQLSGNLLFAAFISYLVGTVFFGGAIRQKNKDANKNRSATIGIVITIIGFLAQVGYFFTRWMAAGHAPISNLFEFTTFFGMMLVFAFIIIYFIYKVSILGVFALPVALLIIAYASMFPRDIAPLVPSLQSYWLQIHVSTAAAGEAILSISFVAGVIYLIQQIDQSRRSKQTFWLEIVLFSLIATVGFVASTATFATLDYKAKFQYTDKDDSKGEITYLMPALVAPYEGVLETEGKLDSGIHVPAMVNAKKLNTVLWSILVGFVLYGATRLVLRKRIGHALQPLAKRIKPDLLDEIGYRAVTIGFPVFTLGALIFAMIWAEVAWSRFWAWDPKETWALITWLFYAAFLHLRLSKGWEGEKSAWLAVIGFTIIMFNLIFVNLVIAGLHSYA